MRSFTDASGNEWPIKIDREAIQLVRKVLQIDLGRPMRAIQRFARDPALIVKALWIILKPLANERDIEPRQFAQMFVDEPETVARAGDAIARALIDEMPRNQGAVLRAVFK